MAAVHTYLLATVHTCSNRDHIFKRWVRSNIQFQIKKEVIDVVIVLVPLEDKEFQRILRQRNPVIENICNYNSSRLRLRAGRTLDSSASGSLSTRETFSRDTATHLGDTKSKS
jgi:hypothetical protein